MTDSQQKTAVDVTFLGRRRAVQQTLRTAKQQTYRHFSSFLGMCCCRALCTRLVVCSRLLPENGNDMMMVFEGLTFPFSTGANGIPVIPLSSTSSPGDDNDFQFSSFRKRKAAALLKKNNKKKEILRCRTAPVRLLSSPIICVYRLSRTR